MKERMSPQQQRMSALAVPGPYLNYQPTNNRPTATSAFFHHLHPVQSRSGGTQATHTKRPLPSFTPTKTGTVEEELDGGIVESSPVEPNPPPPQQQQEQQYYVGHNLHNDDICDSHDEHCVQRASLHHVQQNHLSSTLTGPILPPSSSLPSLSPSHRPNVHESLRLFDVTQSRLGRLSLKNDHGGNNCPRVDQTLGPVAPTEPPLTRSIVYDDRHAATFQVGPRIPVVEVKAVESDSRPPFWGGMSSSSKYPVSASTMILTNDRGCVPSMDDSVKRSFYAENSEVRTGLYPNGSDSSSSSYMMERSHKVVGLDVADAAPAPAVSSGDFSAPSTPQSVTFDSRKHFLIFIKILFRVLDQASEVATRNRARQIVAECTRKNRMGDPHFVPLMEAVERRLQLFVRPAQWRRAHLLWRHYCTMPWNDTTTTTHTTLPNGGMTSPPTTSSSSH